MDITKNLILTGIEANNWTHDEESREILVCIELQFTFFGDDEFAAWLTKKDNSEEWEIASCEGTFELFDSFEPNIESNFDKLMVEVNKFISSHKQQQDEILDFAISADD